MITIKWQDAETAELEDSLKEQIIQKAGRQFKDVTEEIEFTISRRGEEYFHAVIQEKDYKITFQSDEDRLFGDDGYFYTQPFYAMEIHVDYKNKEMLHDRRFSYDHDLKLAIPYGLDYCKVLNNIDNIVKALRNI